MSENLPVAVGQPSRSMIPFSPQNLNEALTISKQLATSDLCPKSFGGKPENVLAAIMMGHELGFGVMQSLSNIAVVNGRASVWGEAVSALILNSGICEYLLDSVSGEGKTMAVTIKTKRTGMPEYSYTYSWADAEKAGLTGKDTYQKYPKDMLYWKCLGRISKRIYADILKGIAIRENMDEPMETESVGRVEIVKPAKVAPAEEKVPTPAEPSPEELLKKAEEAKARVAAEEAKEKAKAEKKAKKVEPTPEPAPAPAPAAAGEEDLKDEPAVAATPVNRVIGTLLNAIKLSNMETGAALGFALVVQSAEGDRKFMVEKYEEVIEHKKAQGKTVEVLWEPLAAPLAGVVGRVAKVSLFQ